MATIQLQQAFNLTASTSYRGASFSDDERYVYFDGGISVFAPYPSSGLDLLSGLSLSRSGAEVFRMTGFSISVGGSWAEDAITRGNLLPFFHRIMAQGDRVTGSMGGDVVDGFGGDDWITGSGGNDRLLGGFGNDTVIGGAGNDTLIGGEGNDTLVTGQQSDIVDGGAGTDTLALTTAAAARVDLALGGTQSFAGGSVRVTGVENLTGGSGNDQLLGSAGHNLLSGGAGDDTLTGRGGNDTLLGGVGNDVLVAGQHADAADGGLGIDTLVMATSAAVRVDLAATTTQLVAGGSIRLAGIENLTTGAGNDQLLGTLGANVLNGGAGNDALSGQAGADRLIGGAGADLLDGGAGADRFVFRAGDGADRIRGMENGIDRIEIASGAERFADLRITDAGANVVIAYGADRITIENLDHRLIDASDFIFV